MLYTARRVLEKNGFVQEGHVREHWQKYGEPKDGMVYGLLASDFREGRKNDEN